MIRAVAEQLPSVSVQYARAMTFDLHRLAMPLVLRVSLARFLLRHSMNLRSEKVDLPIRTASISGEEPSTDMFQFLLFLTACLIMCSTRSFDEGGW